MASRRRLRSHPSGEVSGFVSSTIGVGPPETGAEDAPQPGDTIGAYRLLEPLGKGGVALVFRAEHEVTGQQVALKTVRAPREGLLHSVRREIQALGHVLHPGIVRIFEDGVAEGRPFYTMEMLEGQTLREALRGDSVSHLSHAPSATADAALATSSEFDVGVAGPRSGEFQTHTRGSHAARPRSFEELGWLLTLVRRLCEPLAYIHGEGIIHRDLTPSNVFVRADGTPVLMDFGLVWRLQDAAESREVLSGEMTQAGTLAYMSPEQARGDRMDARTDLFSLGCILYEAITGQLPHVADSWSELLAAHGQPAPSLLLARPDLPSALSEVVMGLLQLQPRDRIGHARDVAAVLADLGAEGWPEPDRPRPKAYLYRPQLVGRAALLEQALGHVAALRRGNGGCVFVGGESGIGKTSFASELARLADLKGVRLITGECAAVGMTEGRSVRQGGPLYPLVRLLQAVADRGVAGGAEVTRRLLGENAKILAAAEPSLRFLPGVETFPEPAEMPGEAARRRLLEALVQTISAFVAEEPTLLVLEDLQWADDLTLAFLSSLSERYYAQNQLLILGTYRSEELARELEQLVTLPYVTNLRLERLDTEAIGAMAAEMLGQREVSQQLAGFLASESSGNPFFAAEYLRATVDAGLLFRDERGRWQQADGAIAFERLGLPRTLKSLVTRRLASLDGPTRELLELASVLGRDVDVDVLSALARETGSVADERSFNESLQRLLAREVIEPTSAGSVRFVHDKLREIAYEDLPLERQKQLHRASALLLEHLHSSDADRERSSATLAHHFEKAGELERALAYFDRAGVAAHAVHANREAFRLLGKANSVEQRLGHRTSPVERARRERLLGLNALALGEVNAALDSLTHAAKLAGRPWPSSRFGLVLRCLNGLGGEVARRWLPALTQAPLDGVEREMALEAARAYERLLVVHYFVTGDSLAVLLSALTNLSLAERAGGVSAERALGNATFAAMCSLLRFDAIARIYCRRAVEMARGSGDEAAETWVLMNVAVAHLQAGRWREMRECLETARGMARKMGFNRRWEESTSQFSTACLLSSNIDEASALNNELLGASERADPQSRCWAVVRQAELSLLKNDVAGAVQAAEQGVRFCEQGLGRAEWIYALGPLALARLRNGDSAGAREAADACSGWMRKGTIPIFYNIVSHACLAEVYFELWRRSTEPGERAALARSARFAVGQLSTIARAMAIARPRARLMQGFEALLLDRKPERARQRFRESLRQAKSLEMPFDQALALSALGKSSPAGGAEAPESREARRIFEELGVTAEPLRLDEPN